MEFADNGTLAQLIDGRRERNAPLRENQVLDVLLQLASALSHLHGRGIIHRDLKPSNIFFDARQLVRLGDFGIAAIVGDGRAPPKQKFLGTPLYVPPEAIEGRPISFKSGARAPSARGHGRGEGFRAEFASSRDADRNAPLRRASLHPRDPTAAAAAAGVAHCARERARAGILYARALPPPSPAAPWCAQTCGRSA
eukprot:419614-Prymnesium_polylepis.1